MKLVAISDTHSLHDDVIVPAGDVLVHAGDLTRSGTLEEFRNFRRWLDDLPHEHKIVIPGNHDFCLENPDRRERILNEYSGARLLVDEAMDVNGKLFWGAPWQPKFFDWAFNRERGPALREKWDLIPGDVDVLVTHGPPKGIGDRVSQGDRVGCAELRKRLKQVRPDLHVFGHIHEGYGEYELDGIRLVNASVCDVRGTPRNGPLVLEL